MATTCPALPAQSVHCPGQPMNSILGAPRGVDIVAGPSAPHEHVAEVRRIVRTEYLRASAVEIAQRTELLEQLYACYSETAHGTTRDQLEVLIDGAGEFRIALFYGADDELAGFSYASIERLEHAGRTHAVFNAAVFCRLGYHGGAPGAFFGLREALRFKLRHPRTPLAYFTRSSSPAAYRLLASTMPRIYPSFAHETPPDVSAMVGELGVRRHYEPVNGEPWVVRSPATPHSSSRLRRLKADPYVQFYNEVNPRFADGNALLTWIPLDFANIVGALFRLLCARLAR
jgi:hypothetical protein